MDVFRKMDGRHIDFTSKDKELVLLFRDCLGLHNKIGKKTREREKIKRYYRIQFGDKYFYEFLVSLGLTPAKSKVLNNLYIPDEYFADFLRGCVDGDGSIGTFTHPESQYPQLRVRLSSASTPFLKWIKEKIARNTQIAGGWIEIKENISVLVYAKADAIVLLRFVYYSRKVPCLNRKESRARPFLRV